MLMTKERQNGHNPMVPYLGRLVKVRDLASEIKLFSVEMLDGGRQALQDYKPGQFAFLSAFGVGEAPFGIASIPQRGETLDFAVSRLGSVTTELHELGEGDLVGVRSAGQLVPMWFRASTSSSGRWHRQARCAR
jgi:NAD(P)H-flavin reductase